MSSDSVIALISALAGISGVAIGWHMLKLASKEHQRNFEQWLAANEPWLRITFEHDTDEDTKGCFMRGFPSFIRLQNQGKLPCRIESVKLGRETLQGRLRKSSISDTSIGGTTKGARLAPGETLHFLLPQTQGLINRALNDGNRIGSRMRQVIPLEITYDYEPKRRRSLTVDVKLVASKKWTLMRVVDSTVTIDTVS